jgi:hypothetical protein
MTEENDRPEGLKVAGFVGWATWGCLMVGIAAFLNGIGALLEKDDFGSAGVSLIASALAFGLLINALLRR